MTFFAASNLEFRVSMQKGCFGNDSITILPFSSQLQNTR